MEDPREDDDLLETRDDWTEAWELAEMYRDAAVERDLDALFTVKPVMVSLGVSRTQKVYGVYLVAAGTT